MEGVREREEGGERKGVGAAAAVAKFPAGAKRGRERCRRRRRRRRRREKHQLKKKLTDDVDPGAEGLRHRLVLVGLEALDDDLLLVRRKREKRVYE